MSGRLTSWASAACVAAVFALAACSDVTDKTQEGEPDRAAAAPTEEVGRPAKTTPAPATAEERQADLERRFFTAQSERCPEWYDGIVEHHQRFGEMLSCERFTTALAELATLSEWKKDQQQDCPGLMQGLTDHYDQWGEMLSCQEFSSALRALAEEQAAEIAEEEARRAEAAAVRAEQVRRLEEARERRVRELEDYVAALERSAHRDGNALVSRQCGSAGGWYHFTLDPYRVWLDRCNPGRNPSPSNDWGGGDLDCEDVREEVWVGDYDPHNLDGDGDGWGCEGW